MVPVKSVGGRNAVKAQITDPLFHSLVVIYSDGLHQEWGDKS